MPGNEPKPGLVGRFIGRIEKRHVFVGLILACIGTGITLWKTFGPADTSKSASSQQSINQQTTGQGSQPVAVIQSGQGNSVHVGDVINYRDPDVAKYAEKYGQTKQLIMSFLRRLKKDKVPQEKWDEALDKIVEEYKKFQELAAAFQSDDPETKRLIEEGSELAAQAKFKEAFEKLEQARQRELDAARNLDEISRKRKTKAAEVTAMQARLKNTQREFLAAARLFENAAGLVEDIDGKASDDYLFKASEAFIDQGVSRGDNNSIEKSISICKKILIKTSRDKDPGKWAKAQHNLGMALQVLGLRETGLERLEQAVAAFRLASEATNRHAFPKEWARTQNNLGNSLAALCQRETSTQRLDLAVTAYRQALEVLTRQTSPIEWARINNNLGNAYFLRGLREGGDQQLELAVSVYRQALEVLNKQVSPFEWARTKHNLGTTLDELSLREPGTLRLEQAIVAFRQSLEVRTRKDSPMEWAMTQNGLGNAFQELGRRIQDDQLLERAIAMYRMALEVFTIQASPMDWARTMHNLGLALRQLGKSESNPARLKEAVEAHEAALAIVKKTEKTHDIEVFTKSLHTSRKALAEARAETD